MRALVLSDTHFGAWTGEDILRQPQTLALLGPHLDADEVIFLGDMFDFLFGTRRAAFDAASGLFDLLRERLQGKRFVFLAGNHDHHFVARAAEELLELELATGRRADQLRGEVGHIDFFHQLLSHRLEGVEVDVRYPTYTFADVLCTHGHYLDFHARRGGAAPGRLLARLLWSIAVGGTEHPPTIEDYEATITILTGVLYTIAQLPNGTHAQRRVYGAFQRLERAGQLGAAPLKALERVAAQVGARGAARRERAAQQAEYEDAREWESQWRERTGAPAGAEVSSYAFARLVRPSDPAGHALEAFDKAVRNLGWDKRTDKIVFAHTHQPLDCVTPPGSNIRYWNTGSWIYEPDLSSKEAYLGYLKNAWPGTAVVIDSDDARPCLVRLREHLNPLRRVDGDQHP